MRAVIVRADLEVGSRREGVGVAREDVSSGDAGHQRPRGAGPGADPDRRRDLPDVAGVGVTLESQLVAGGKLPVGAEAEVTHFPFVGVGAIGIEFARAIESLGEDAEKKSGLELAAVADAAESALGRPAAAFEIRALRLLGALAGDVDDAV